MRPGSVSWFGHGLVRPSFVPPRPIRELRELTRYRKTQIQERSREVQRLDKVLQDAGIKLSSVATDVLGVSGRAMLEALVAGTHDPHHIHFRKAMVDGNRLGHRVSRWALRHYFQPLDDD